MFLVYVIRNEFSGKIYIGQTAKLKSRLARHNLDLRSKTKSYTYKNKGWWKVVYQEMYNTRKEAIKREKQLKSYQGRKFIKEKFLGP